MISDRESVINLHMGIPKQNGLRDDVQLMWSGSALDNYGYSTARPTSARATTSRSTRSTARKLRPPICGQEKIELRSAVADGQRAVATGRSAPGPDHPRCKARGRSLAALSPPSSTALGCAPTYLGYADASPTTCRSVRRSRMSFRQNIKAPGIYFAPGRRRIIRRGRFRTPTTRSTSTRTTRASPSCSTPTR